MLLNGGTLGGARILSSDSVTALATDQIPHMTIPAMGLMSPMGPRSVDFFDGRPTGWTLAFQINREPTTEGRAAGSLFWGGFANTFYWIDPVNGLAGVFITQVVPFFDPRSVTLFKAFEREVYRSR
jgi:CubicO group peptidase (beta-lactamase class C family)